LSGLVFLYCGTESAIGGWAATFAKRFGDSSEHWWELAPMFFWAGLLSGRALSPLILGQLTERAVLTLGLTLAGVCNAGLLVVANPAVAAITLLGAGFGFACIFPLLVALLVGTFGEHARRLGTIVFAGANLGGATIPWLVGFASTRVGSLQAGLAVPLVACMMMLALVQLLKKQPPAVSDRLIS